MHRVHELLDRRKNATSVSSLASLTENYGMDPELLDHLAGVVNSPSIRAGTGVQFIHTDTGEKTLGMTVRATLSFSTQSNYVLCSRPCGLAHALTLREFSRYRTW